MNIDDKQLLINTIDNYHKITGSQKQLLKVLVDINNLVSTQVILKKVGLKKQSVYLNLKKLLALNLIKKTNDNPALFFLNDEVIAQLIKSYNQRYSELTEDLSFRVTSIREKISKYLDTEKIGTSIFEKKARLPRSTVTRLLNGKIINPSTHTLIKIAKAMDCSLDQLFTQETQQKKL